jgi:hypothetical protein
MNAEAQGHPSSNHCKIFRIVDNTIRRLIPADPLNSRYALHKPLNRYYRISKGRLRIVWAVLPDYREVMIVFISTNPRKEGDARDPYAIVTAMKKAGYLDGLINDWRRAKEAMSLPPDARVN